VVRETFDMMGSDRMILISDSLRSTGMPDGRYILGELDVIKKGKECRLADSGNIAGSTCDLFECMRTAVFDMKIPLENAVAAATINPARCIGVDDKRGSLEAGKVADLLLLNKKDLSLKAVFMKGTLIK
jgi:N-acetylglucosamine-6-phosphate deacetylase